MKRRDIKLDEYKITAYQYRELYNFCMQYEDKVRQRNDLYNTYQSPAPSIGRGAFVGNPPAAAAEKIDRLNRDIALIEQTAREADPEIGKYIVYNVTKENCPYWALQSRYDIPCSREYFEKRRRRFYFLLALKKGML